MQNFLQDIQSIYWWISVIVVGLILNLAADYIRSGLDKLSGSIFKRIQDRSVKSKEEIEQEIHILVDHPNEIIRYEIVTTRLTVQILVPWVGTMTGFILWSLASHWGEPALQIIFAALMAVAFFISFQGLYARNRRLEIIRTAVGRLKMKQESEDERDKDE